MRSKHPIDLNQAAEIINRILSSPITQSNPALQTYIRSFQLHPTPVIYNKITDLWNRLGHEQFDPHDVRKVESNDPVTHGDIALGVDRQTRQIVSLLLLDMVNHLLIKAEHGGGKTTLQRTIISQLVRAGYPVLVFQKKTNQFEFLKDDRGYCFTTFYLDEIRLPLFETNCLDQFHRWLHQAVTPISEVFELQFSRGILATAINEMGRQWPGERIEKEGFPTIRDLQRVLNDLKVKSHQKKYADSADNVLRWIWETNSIFHARRGMYEQLCNHPTVILYSDGQVHIVELVIIHLADRFVQDNERRKPEDKQFWFIVIDDAQEILEARGSNRLPPLINKLNLTRENRLGFVFSFHSVKKIEPRFLSSGSTRIMGHTPDHNEAVFITKALGIRPEYAAQISLLSPGQFILRSPSSYGAVSFQGYQFESPYPDHIAQWRQDNEKRKQDYHSVPYSRSPYASQDNSNPPDQESNEWSESSRRLLLELANHPYSTSTELRSRLHLNPTMYGKYIAELEGRRLIRKHAISRFKAFEILPAGWEYLNLTAPSHKGGFEHAFAIDKIVTVFQRCGYRTQTEHMLAPSRHQIDVVAFKKIILAAEYETGHSSIVSNMKQCCSTHADRIIIIVATEKQKHHVLTCVQNDFELENEIRRKRLQIKTLWTFLKSVQ